MTTINRTENFSQTVHDLKIKNVEKDGKVFGQEVEAAAHDKKPSASNKVEEELTVDSVKQEYNSRILQATLNVSVSAGNEPLSLLLKTAIEGINKALEPEMGPNAIQNSYDSGIDVTPEATAERILSLSTAFFPSYREQHPEFSGLSDQQVAEKFIDVISAGIEQGFSEAKDILGGLNVLKGDIASNIDATYDLVQQGLKAFVDDYSEKDQ